MTETIVGLEIHVELKTESKMFCSCASQFAKAPNTLCCPICMGLPGALPRVNERAAELGALAGRALHSQMQPISRFDRKQYFYPDLPKGYQITQHAYPLCRGGYLRLPETGRKISIAEMHLEEDAGKIIHRDGKSYVDLNRCGVPLLEIVTEPVLSGGEEAAAFLTLLRDTLIAAGVTTGKMQEGAMRVDVNVSLRQDGVRPGPRTEMKNLSSFRAVRAAIDHEAERQRALLQRGESIPGETRRWDERGGFSVSLRKKEGEMDYRYFPEPDLPPLRLDVHRIEKMYAACPELPESIQMRLLSMPGMTPDKAAQLARQPGLLRCFDTAFAAAPDAKKLLNWLLGDYRAIARKQGLDPAAPPFSPAQFACLMQRALTENLSYQETRTGLEEICRTK